MTGGWSGPAPAEITAWTVVRAGHAVGRRFWGALAEVGLTPVEFGVLLVLDADPGLSNAAVAREVLVTPQSMSALMNGLETDGLVERRAEGGRGTPVRSRLTAAGRRRLRACEAVVARVEDSLGLTAADRATLNRLLHGVLESGE